MKNVYVIDQFAFKDDEGYFFSDSMEMQLHDDFIDFKSKSTHIMDPIRIQYNNKKSHFRNEEYKNFEIVEGGEIKKNMFRIRKFIDGRYTLKDMRRFFGHNADAGRITFESKKDLEKYLENESQKLGDKLKAQRMKIAKKEKFKKEQEAAIARANAIRAQRMARERELRERNEEARRRNANRARFSDIDLRLRESTRKVPKEEQNATRGMLKT